MCNSVVALGSATRDGIVVFGKNTDRDPNEALVLESLPAARHQADARVQCTYLELPQVRRTNAVLLARPCWMWGAEMGSNEHGLTIGNTAVFTRVPYQEGPGLTGMDFLRLALERTSTSREALDLITDLLETYGQGGNCGFSKPFTYHNSFILADHQSAWILETAGRHWIAEKVKDVRATSNTLTITTDYDEISDDTIDYAILQGWHKAGTPFNFKKSYGGAGIYTSYLFTLFGRGDGRQNRLTTLLEREKGDITVASVMAMLRDHGPKAGPDYSPANGFFGNSVCMHAGWGPVRTDQTTGSMVSHITAENPTHWLNGTSAPCTGIFKPVWLDSGLPDIGVPPTGRYSRNPLWWQHETLHREVLRDYCHRLGLYREERDQMEAEFMEEALAVSSEPSKRRRHFTRDCFARAAEATARWAETVHRAEPQKTLPRLYGSAWDARNQKAQYFAGNEITSTHNPGL